MEDIDDETENRNEEKNEVRERAIAEIEIEKKENNKKIFDAVIKEVKAKVITDILGTEEVIKNLKYIALGKQAELDRKLEEKAKEKDEHWILKYLPKKMISPENKIAIFFETKEGNKELRKISYFRYANIFNNEIIFDEKRDSGYVGRWTERKLFTTRTYPCLDYVEGRITPITYKNARLPMDEALLSRKVNADFNMQMHEAKRTGIGGVEEKTGMILAFICGIFAGLILPYIGGF